METDVPTCGLDSPIADVMRTLDEHAGWEQCIVVNQDGIVLGVVPRAEPGAARSACEAMRHGPTTMRPDVELDETLVRMRKRSVKERIVTDPTGRLLGVLRLPT